METAQGSGGYNNHAIFSVESRTLYIVEVFRNVCASMGSQALARLARCCRAFHDPALRLLWYHIPSLRALIETFPDDVIEIDPLESYVSMYPRILMLTVT